MKMRRYLAMSALLTSAAISAGCGEDDPGQKPPITPGTPGEFQVGEMVDVDIEVPVILPNNWGNQISSELRPFYTNGSELGRMSLWARFCEDSLCARPVSYVQLDLRSSDEHGRYLLSTATPSGEPATDTAAVWARLRQAPAGASYMQLIGDTQRGSVIATCGEPGARCPSEMDVLQTAVSRIAGEGSENNPAPSTTKLESIQPGEKRELPLHYMGHLVLGVTLEENPATSSGERLLVAHSNATNTFRNHVSLFDLDKINDPQARVLESKELMIGHNRRAGDICGLIFEDGDSEKLGIWLSVDANGASARFVEGDELVADPSDNNSTGTLAAPDPNNAERWPWPCQGFVVREGLYDTAILVQFQGGGSLKHSQPWPVYSVRRTRLSGRVSTVMTGYYGDTKFADYALRDIVPIPDTSTVVALEMDWSKHATTNGIGANRLVFFERTTGVAAASSVFPTTPDYEEITLTGITSSFECGEALGRPSGMVSSAQNSRQLLIGHDDGIAVFDLDEMKIVQNLNLTNYGHGYTQILRDGDGYVAVPQCKSSTARFELPYQSSTSAIDRHILVELDFAANGSLRVRPNTIDIDGDGASDGGIDIDNFFLKRWLRSLIGTHPLPPFVITFPRAAVGADVIAVRGAGIQGSSLGTDSNSGMGALGDVSVYSRATGQFYNLRGRNPVFEGTGDEKYRVGLQLQSFENSSTGAMVILR